MLGRSTCDLTSNAPPIETESLGKLVRSEFRSANRQAVHVRESSSKFVEQAPALLRRLLVPAVPLAELAAVPSSSAVAEPPVPGPSDC